MLVAPASTILRLGFAFSFRPCVSFSGYRTRQSSPPNPPMTPPYSGNWAREDGSCELDARKLALSYGPALSGTWVWAHGTPSASPCANATRSLTIFGSVVVVAEVSEDMIHAVIGVSGSSPTYTYMYIDTGSQREAVLCPCHQSPEKLP